MSNLLCAEIMQALIIGHSLIKVQYTVINKCEVPSQL